MNTCSLRMVLAALVVLATAMPPAVTYGQSAPPAGPAGFAKAEDVPALIAVLKQADAPLFDKARACQKLADVGTRDAVPALAALLADEKLGNYARSGLERIPDPSADDALRDALGKLRGNLLVGVVNSIGVRRDPKAVGALIELARDRSKGAATAALAALGRIATAEAIDELRKALTTGPAELRPATAEGCLLAAEGLAAQGKRDAAVALFDAVRAAEVPQAYRLAATHGAILARQTAGVPLLIEQLKSDDRAMLGVALGVIRELPGPEVAPAVAAELAKAKPALQVLLVKALADRGDAAVCGAIEALAASDAPEVRTEALAALGKIGGPSSLPVLLKALETGKSDAESAAAAASLTRITVKDANLTILKAMPSAPPATRARLITVLGHRNATEATAEILKQAAAPEAAVSEAAFAALATLARPADVPEMIRLTLACKDDSVRGAAERAVLATCARLPDAAVRADTLVAALGESKDAAARGSLVRMLAGIADAKAFAAVQSALSDPDAAVRGRAIRCLGDWPDATPATVLLGIVKSAADPAERSVALRGAVRMAGMVAAASPTPSPQAIAWMTEANQAVRSDVNEKRLILSGLANLKSVEGLQLVQPYLADPAVEAEAAQAVIQIARQMPGDRLMAKSVLEKIAATTKNEAIRKPVQEVIQQIPGKSVELTAPAKSGG